MAGGSNTSNKPAPAPAVSGYVPASSTQATSGSDPFGSFSNLDGSLTDNGSQGITTQVGGGYHPGNLTQDHKQTGDTLLRGLYQMPKDQIKALQQKLLDAGFSGVSVTGVVDATTINAYQHVLASAQAYQTANPDSSHPFTPSEILDSMASAKASKDKTSTSTDTVVSLTNPVQARQVLITAMADKLGRKPTDAEVAAFTSNLNQYEQSNPSTTTTATDTTTDASGQQSIKSQNTQTSDKGTGSLNFTNDYAKQYVLDQHSPEVKATEGLSWYNVALQALQGSGINTGNPT